MTFESETEKLDNTEERIVLEVEAPNSSSTIHLDQILNAIEERFAKLEKIKSDIPPKTYQLVFAKIQHEQSEVTEQFKKESEQRAERERVTQSLPKAYFEQRFLRVKEIRID